MHPMRILANVIPFLKPQRFLLGAHLPADGYLGKILQLLHQRWPVSRYV
jgi:hypothetical protein